MRLRHRLYLLKEKIKNDYLLPISRKSYFLADLYYFVFSKEFSREHQKVLNGKYMHLQALKSNAPNVFHLRRQIHRLEKGLIMKDRRSVFAADYILDTVHNYERVYISMNEQRLEMDEGLLIWGASVLKYYFSQVGHHENVQRARALFEAIHQESGHIQSHVPYRRNTVKSANVSYEGLFDLAMQRRSVRWYQDKPVDRAQIEQAIRIASLSPSACNRQPFEFHVYDTEDLKNRVGSIPMGIRPFHRQIPVFVVLVGKLSAYLSERDRHVIYIDGGLAAMSFMLALETLGLSSVPINWPDIEEIEQQMDRTLGLAEDERPIMLIGLGYADPEGMIPYSQKKSTDIITRYH